MITALHNVLFLSPGNSARSIMAEGLMNHLGSNRFVAYSAGYRPKGFVDPIALSTLEKLKVASPGYRSKAWGEFSGPDGPAIEFLITLSDDAADAIAPDWPERPMSVHWSVADPSAALGSYTDKLQVYMDVAVALKRRIELMLALPMSGLDAIAMHREMSNIGGADA